MTSSSELLLHLLVQLVVILLACLLTGGVTRRLGQTQVIGEMVAGVLLGPSLLGLVAPELQQWLFPTSLMLTIDGRSASVTHPSMVLLFGLSQIGLMLFMFVIGLELNTALAVSERRHTGAISLLGVLMPLVLGGALGTVLARDGVLFPPGILPFQAALFLGAAMAVTALPVLARIIHEEGIVHTRVGTMALAAAAGNDAMAWSLLAIVVATMAGSSPVAAVVAIGGGLAYAVGMLTVGRRLLSTFDRIASEDYRLRPETLAVLLLILLSCAWLTEWIGMHAVFGAFVCGAVMPRGWVAKEAGRQIEGLAVPLLLPIFFVYSGLNTRVELLLEPSLLAVAATVVVVAFICKGGACAIASRLAGASWREAAAIGALMNARGLMELILINIGLETGLIGPGLFTVLVLMTIVTTAAASPLFRLFWRPEPSSRNLSAHSGVALAHQGEAADVIR
jgi:Kef-type K+ transport system membrane component KefB